MVEEHIVSVWSQVQLWETRVKVRELFVNKEAEDQLRGVESQRDSSARGMGGETKKKGGGAGGGPKRHQGRTQNPIKRL